MTELTQKELIELAITGARQLSIQFYELWEKTEDSFFLERFNKYVDITDDLTKERFKD